jgi:hypothetical protein
VHLPNKEEEEEEYILLVKCNVKYIVRYENQVILATKRGGTKKDNFDESVNNFAYIFWLIEWL